MSVEGFSVGLYGWGVQLLVGFSYNYSFFLSANWLMNLVFAASTKRKKKSGATINYFLSIFCRGSGLTPCLEDTYSFLIYLFRLFLCDDKLNKNCGFEIIYLGIFSSFEMSIFFIKRRIFPQKNLNLTSSFPLHTTYTSSTRALNAVVNSLTTQPFTRLTRIKTEITSLFDFVVYMYTKRRGGEDSVFATYK